MQQNKDEKPKEKDKKRHIRIGAEETTDVTADAAPVFITLNDCLACRYARCHHYVMAQRLYHNGRDSVNFITE